MLACEAGHCGGAPPDPEINTPPVARDDVHDVEIGVPLHVDALSGARLLANDVDADGHGVIVVDPPTHSERGRPLVVGVEGSVDYDPGTLRGCDRFTYTIDDGHGGTASAAVALNIRLRQLSWDTLTERGLGASMPELTYGATVVGDVNGDGKDDIVAEVHTDEYHIDYQVIFGALTLLPQGVALADLPAAGLGFLLASLVTGSDVSTTISRIGDLDADGMDDFYFSRYSIPAGGYIETIVLGRTSTAPAQLEPLEPGQGIVVPREVAVAGGVLNVGYPRPAGDFNGDGIDDIVLPMTYDPAAMGVAETDHIAVVFGAAGLSAIDLPAVVAGVGGAVIPTLDLAAPDGLVAYTQPGVGGDLDGDGATELVFEGYQGQPLLIVVRGAPALQLTSEQLLQGVGGFVLTSDAGSLRGAAVGDLGGDGLADLAVTRDESGELFILTGDLEPGVYAVAALVAEQRAIRITTTQMNSAPSIAARRWDLDGDGNDDLMLPGHGVVHGPITADLVVPDAIGVTVPGFRASFSEVGDLNGDGRADLLFADSVLRGDDYVTGCEPR